jgi:hypothetical protein
MAAATALRCYRQPGDLGILRRAAEGVPESRLHVLFVIAAGHQ